MKLGIFCRPKKEEINLDSPFEDKNLMMDLLESSSTAIPYLKKARALFNVGQIDFLSLPALELSLTLSQIHPLGLNAPAATLYYNEEKKIILMDQSLPIGIACIFFAHELVHATEPIPQDLEEEIAIEFRAYQLQSKVTHELIDNILNYDLFLKLHSSFNLLEAQWITHDEIRSRYLKAIA